MSLKIEEIKKKVSTAVNLLIKQDFFLLQNDVNERSISHKLAVYLQQRFPEYHVDCEYNRMKNQGMDNDFIKKTLRLTVEDIKSDDTKAKTVYPDIIIHHRGTNNNLLVIEVKKKDNNASKEFDSNGVAKKQWRGKCI